MIRSPLRSPVALASGNERDTTAGASDDIIIHEDSASSAGHRSPPNPSDDKPVLEELPLNEQASEPPRDDSPSRRGLKTPLQSYLNGGEQNGISNGFTDVDSGVDQAETQRSRKLLNSGLNSIRARTLEAHGFRRLQEIVRSNADVWGEGPEHAKYGELLVALLGHLEAPSQSFKCPSPKVVGLKAQGLATIKAMLDRPRDAAPYLSRVICAVLVARGSFSGIEYIVAELERVAEDVVKATEAPAVCIDAVLDLLESPDVHDEDEENEHERPKLDGRTVSMALGRLAQLLVKTIKDVPSMGEAQTERLGAVAVKCLNDPDPDVRRADLEFCLALYERMSREEFARVVGKVGEGGLNLIAYYVARRGRAAA